MKSAFHFFLALNFLACFAEIETGWSQENSEKLAPIFNRLDTNSDGQLSIAEAGKRGALVRAADADKDGAATLEEIRTYLRGRLRPAEPDPAAKPQVIAAEISADASVSKKSCEAAALYSAERNGYSFLVMHEGRILYERYDQGWTTETPHRLASGTKSFSAAILAAAVQDKLLTLDEPTSKTLTEWQSDEALSLITFQQLLSLTSGIHPGAVGAVPSYREAVTEAKALQPPGKKFAYGPAPYQVFGEVIRRKLAAREDLDFADPLAYLKARMFDPIGLKFADWRLDADGMPHLPSGAHLAAREWAKYGDFLLDDGKWEGKPLVDSETLTRARKGTKANPVYGLTFWLLRNPGSPELQGAYSAAGAGKQKLYVIPKLDLVVVRQGETKRFDDAAFLKRLIGK